MCFVSFNRNYIRLYQHGRPCCSFHFSLSHFAMLQFCFPLSCHLFEMVFIPLLLKVMSLVLKLGRCVVSTDYYLTIIICTICIRHIPCSAECSSLLPPQSCTLCTTYTLISSVSSVIPPPNSLVDVPLKLYYHQLSSVVIMPNVTMSFLYIANCAISSFSACALKC